MTALTDRNPAVRYTACWALDESGSTSPALVRALVGRLETESEQSCFEGRRDPQQINVIASLKRIKVPAPTLAALLVKAMASEDRFVRLGADRGTLRRRGTARPDGPGGGSAPAQVLRDEEARIRMLAARAWPGSTRPPGGRRSRSPGAVPNAEPPRALEAAVGLARFDPEAKEVVKILTDRLEQGDAADRLANLYLLGRLGPLARPAVPAVVRAMTRATRGGFGHPFWPDSRFPTTDGTPNGAPGWRTSTSTRGNTRKRRRTCATWVRWSSARVGPDAEREAVDALTAMLRDDDESQLAGAVLALKALGPTAALPALIALGREASDRPGKDRDMLMQAIAEGLDKVGKGSDEQVVETLVAMLSRATRQNGSGRRRRSTSISRQRERRFRHSSRR